MPGTIKHQARIFRENLRQNPLTLYVFGDNMSRVGLGGQAKEMRGEPNAVGIPTKWAPFRGDEAFFRDEDFDLSHVRATIDNAIVRLADHIRHGGNVIFPEDGIGTGLAELPTRAPKIYNYILFNIELLEHITKGE